jgi:hypothetical protein
MESECEIVKFIYERCLSNEMTTCRDNKGYKRAIMLCVANNSLTKCTQTINREPVN